MKAVRLLPETHLFLLFVLSVIFPVAAYSDAYTDLLIWTGWGISSKAIQTPGDISKLSFRGSHPPLHLTYGLNTVDQSSKTVPELENNQFYIIQNGQPGDLFNFCFRTPPALSVSNLPSPPVITKSATGRGMSEIKDGGVKLVPLAHDSGRWQYQYSARWRIPTGSQSLLLVVEDNHNGWVIEPECSGIVSESTALPSSLGSKTSDNKKTSFVDIIFRNTETKKNEPDHPDDSSRSSGPLAIPGAPDTADNSEPFPSSGGGGFGGSDDLDDLFKKRPGGGRAPLYVFEWMSELFSRVILVPVPGTDGKTVKKQIWDTRIVLNIKQGWNEQAIIISQELWNKIRAAHLERSSGLFLALSSNPNNPEAVFDHYLSNNPPQSFQTEDYQGYEQQVLILNPKQLRSVSVFPGHCPTGVSCPGGAGQAEKQTADLRPSSYARSQEYGRLYQDRGGFGGRGSDEDDGSGGAPNNGLCIVCQNPAKPVFLYNKCQDCLDSETNLLEEEPVIEQPPEIRRGEAIPISAPKAVDTSAVIIFQWFKNLLAGTGDYFHHREYYKLPQLYKLLTHSFLSNVNTLRKFHSKWNEFTRGNVGLYDLILEVGKLVKSQGGEKHVEVARIVKALAFYRKEFVNEDGVGELRNNLKTYLETNNILPTDDEVLYSRLDDQQKAELINFIYQKFKQTGDVLKEETVPSQFNIIRMLNVLAREVYSKYGFGLPDINDQGLKIIVWGYPLNNKYSFITQLNNERLSISPSHQSLQGLVSAIGADVAGKAEDVRAMITALTVIRSMFEVRAKAILSQCANSSNQVDHDQLDLLGKFAIKARQQLGEILKLSDPEQKEEFIRNMFLIFGVVPREIMDELTQESDPGLGSIRKRRAQVAEDPQHKKSKTRNQSSGPLKIDSAMPEAIYIDLATDIGVKWKMFGRCTGVLKNPHIDNIDANSGDAFEKAYTMLAQWRQMKEDGAPTFRNLLDILGRMALNKTKFEIIGRYGL
ncbi:death domain-containing protein [Endozoicomonas sp. 4G]|uniref:death domain-containing protein n=1 Tax=Endozoicomonas sp. 4G TaxID=2872754 RepID=UPI0020788A84|nr:death domain-containing protein [Endozoicomonas sp. 4G]